MELLIEVRNVYGNEMVYPANEAARLFAQIAGTKTLSHGTLAAAERLGYEITIVPNRAEVVTMARYARVSS